MNGYEDKYLREKVNRMIARQKEGKIIRTYLKPPSERGRLIDPCAGEGKAATFLGNALNCETWGGRTLTRTSRESSKRDG